MALQDHQMPVASKCQAGFFNGGWSAGQRLKENALSVGTVSSSSPVIQVPVLQPGEVGWRYAAERPATVAPCGSKHPSGSIRAEDHNADNDVQPAGSQRQRGGRW